jgi:hypothetical protein
MIRHLTPPPPLHPPPGSVLSLFLSLHVCRRSSLLTGEGGDLVVGEEPKQTPKRPWPSNNHSMLAVVENALPYEI